MTGTRWSPRTTASAGAAPRPGPASMEASSRSRFVGGGGGRVQVTMARSLVGLPEVTSWRVAAMRIENDYIA